MFPEIIDAAGGPERVSVGNDRVLGQGDYVLYWMQSSHRTRWNHALSAAIRTANRQHLPLLVFFALDPAYPEANARSYRFMLEGLADVAADLPSLGTRLIVRTGPPPRLLAACAKHASLVVTDQGYLRPQLAYFREAAALLRCPLVRVESNVIVPVMAASPREEYSAATFRPKVMGASSRFLDPPPEEQVDARREIDPDPGMPDCMPDANPALIERTLAAIRADESVGRGLFPGGQSAAAARFDVFLSRDLDRYAQERNDPAGNIVSHMSPYLHFGQESPLRLALAAMDRDGPGPEAFLEELIVRRELAVNFVTYNPSYDSPACLPEWAAKTLRAHAGDPRPYRYSAAELEAASTHDPYWNAAQNEMRLTGKMHGYMRMYWGKKCIEWIPDPGEAFSVALALNNRYEIDGRDPNGYAGVAWCFGKHDRPFSERPVFGKVRYMSFDGLVRKFDMERYVAYVERLGSL
jgi:deoxyribodipyrimidine photo-lyase